MSRRFALSLSFTVVVALGCAASAACGGGDTDGNDVGAGDDSAELRSTEVVRGYKLPFAAGQTYGIVQFPHAYRDQIWNAVDIGVPRGGEILAMKSGTVSAVIDTFPDYRAGYVCNWAACNDVTNFVIIQHDDGQESSYLHLAQGSVRALGITPGKRVCQGQPIGKVGHNGYSYGPHVHVSVQSGGSKGDRNQAWTAMWSKPTKVIQFDEASPIRESQRYTSQNRKSCAGGAPASDAGAKDAGGKDGGAKDAGTKKDASVNDASATDAGTEEETTPPPEGETPATPSAPRGEGPDRSRDLPDDEAPSASSGCALARASGRDAASAAGLALVALVALARRRRPAR
jgi:murein DD-endopeptidase MepM/ murein hydrolase activator NlpD